MKIVILDGYAENPGDLSWQGFGELAGPEGLTVYDYTPADKILARMEGAEIVLTNKTPLTAETIAACPELKYIGVLATGYNVVDIAAAKAHGVSVTNIPTYGTSAVAQYTMACRSPQRQCAAGRLDKKPGLLLLELPADRAGGEDYGADWLRAHRPGGG